MKADETNKLNINPEPIIYGKGQTPCIVSVECVPWKQNATVYTRTIATGVVKSSQVPFNPFILLDSLELLEGLIAPHDYHVVELNGHHKLKYKVVINNFRKFTSIATTNYNKKYKGENVTSLFRIEKGGMFLNTATQFLIETGETLFKGMTYKDLHRVQFDIETTGLDPEDNKIFMIQVGDSSGYQRVIEGNEGDIIREFVRIVKELNPDVLEGYNINSFDLPFIKTRAEKLGLKLTLGRDGSELNKSYKGHYKSGAETKDTEIFNVFGRQVIDVYIAVDQYQANTKKLDDCKLKTVAKHFGVAPEDRVYIEGDKIYETYLKNPELVKKYGMDDVNEVMAVSEKLMQDKFELTKIVPDTFQSVLTMGQTKKIEYLVIREYLNQNNSLPEKYYVRTNESYQGADAKLYVKGLVNNVVKADVESLYPNTMLKIGAFPEADTLGVMKELLSHLLKLRIDTKEKLNTCDAGERESINAQQLSYKVLINSFYGVMGAGNFLFTDPKQAARVTAFGRNLLQQMTDCIIELGGTPVESDTDGIYFTYDGDAANFIEKLNNKINTSGIKIAYEGSWSKGIFFGVKNYILLKSDGSHLIKGSSIKSSRITKKEKAIVTAIATQIISGNIIPLRDIYVSASAFNIESDCVKETLGKSPTEYKVKMPILKALEEASLLPQAKKGQTYSYYKSTTGYKLKERYNNDEDKNYYDGKVHKILDKFNVCLSESDISAIIDTNIPLTTLQGITPRSTTIGNDVTYEWIELAYGIKLDKVTRKTFMLDDVDGILAFIKKYNNTDIYVSSYKHYSQSKPAKGVSCPMLGDYWIEFEDKTNPENQDVLRARDQAYNLLVNVYGINPENIQIIFNGGKSHYIRVNSCSLGIEKPEHNLNEKHKAITEDIKRRLPAELSRFIDLNIYKSTQVLRIIGSVYPGKNQCVIVESNYDYSDPISNFFLPTIDEVNTNPIISTIYNKVNIKPSTKGTKNYHTKNKLEKELANEVRKTFGKLQLPCCRELLMQILQGKSIGFDGRNKFIQELSIAGFSEDDVVGLFLRNGDPNRYNVLEPCIESPSGYRLKYEFKFDAVNKYKFGCSNCSDICDGEKCYKRNEVFRGLLNIQDINEGVTHKEFMNNAQKKLDEALNQILWGNKDDHSNRSVNVFGEDIQDCRKCA